MRTHRFGLAVFAAAATFAAAGPAFAHTGDGAHSFSAGLAHPWGGLDHLAVMLAVGWAALARTGGRLSSAAWASPAAFVAAMAAGAGLVWAGVSAPWAEAGIIASIGVMAVLLALGARAPLGLTLAAIAVSGVAHGAAHGLEAVGYVAGAFLAGFIASTAALHGLGMIAGAGLARSPRLMALGGRYAAAAGLSALCVALSAPMIVGV